MIITDKHLTEEIIRNLDKAKQHEQGNMEAKKNGLEVPHPNAATPCYLPLPDFLTEQEPSSMNIRLLFAKARAFILGG